MFWLKDKTVLITGGTGSFGRRCAQVLLEQADLRRLILLGRDEQKHVELRRNCFPPEQFPQVRFFVGDVRDPGRLRTALRDVDYVIHAAAMKHVDMAEYNPQECIATNVGGAQNVIQACLESGVTKVVALSTDKAASPINLYGATKLCSDKLFVASNSLAGHDGTRFCVVRYGNVLNSNGSVVPFFLKQRTSGVLPITDPGMTRFIITLEQGVWFVLEALRKMAGGEVFIPRIPSVTIGDIAKAVAPECRTEIVGIRPGEKLHECMIPGDEARSAIEFDDHYIIKPVSRTWDLATPWYESGGSPCPCGFSYTSDNNDQWLSSDELRQLILDEFPEANTAQTCATRNASDPSRILPNRQTGRPNTDKHDTPVTPGQFSGPERLPYSRHTIDSGDIAAVTRVLESDWLTTGPVVGEFENAVAKYSGGRRGVAFCNGTAALHAAVSASGAGPGDEIIVPAITFVATANAAVHCGATPVFADVCPDTLLVDALDVETKISSRTRAIVAVDYAGQTCNYARLRRLADQHGLSLIADSCHALGGTCCHQPVPQWADMACYSFHPVKQITTCEGGMVVTNSDQLADYLSRFRNHGIDQDHWQRAATGDFLYDMESPGFNYRLSDVHCALGISQLEKLPEWTAQRIHLATGYRERLNGLDWVTPLSLVPDASHSYHLFVVRWNRMAATCRDETLATLRRSGVGANLHYRPVYHHSFYRRTANQRPPTRCPAAESSWKEILSLPLFPGMAERQLDRICGLLIQAGTTRIPVAKAS